MRKPELVNAVAAQTGLTKEKANEVISALTDQIREAMARKDEVSILGFGSFSVRQRSARSGRNPKTGATITIPASQTVGFKVGKALKDAVKG